MYYSRQRDPSPIFDSFDDDKRLRGELKMLRNGDIKGTQFHQVGDYKVRFVLFDPHLICLFVYTSL